MNAQIDLNNWMQATDFGRPVNPISTRGPSSLQLAPPPCGFSVPPKALMQKIWELDAKKSRQIDLNPFIQWFWSNWFYPNSRIYIIDLIQINGSTIMDWNLAVFFRSWSFLHYFYYKVSSKCWSFAKTILHAQSVCTRYYHLGFVQKRSSRL